MSEAPKEPALPHVPQPVPVAPEAEHPDEDLVGTVINNNYRITRLIGRGGMGEVYEGEHLFTGNRIAIKLVLQSLSRDAQILALFKREARTLFQLTDDAIVRYLDSVHDQALDRYCLVMDYIDGLHLSEHVQANGPLPPEAARRLIRRLAGALQRAHQMGVTHRDLSPDNVMLRGGDVEQAVLIDFGIAKSERADDATLHGQLAGKFKYISPEQLGHFDGVVGPQTDVYGLALLIAAALRGQPIDMGSSVVAAVEARRQIPPLDGVPAEMVPLLSHMLEPDPANRPVSMAMVVDLLDHPGHLPAKYRQAQQGVMDTGERTVIAQPAVARPAPAYDSQRTVIAAPPGGAELSVPPMAQAGGPGLTPGWSQPPAQEQTGGFTGLPLPPEPQEERTPHSALRKLMLPALALVLAGGAFGGYVLLGPDTITQTTPLPPDPGSTPNPEPAQQSAQTGPQLPPPDATTREGFLAANLKPEACAYATRITAGGNSGRLELFGTAPATLNTITQGYREAFGAAPATILREITPAQCAALDFVRALQGRDISPPLLTLDTDTVASGGALQGRVSDARGRSVWLFLVSASGAVHNLSTRLEPQSDGSWLFAFGARSLSGKAEAQLLVAITSAEPLLTAAAAPSGAQAELLLPAVLAEIAGKPGRASGQMAYFLLTP